MRIGIPAEVRSGETRVAATPETVKKLTTGGRHEVVVQSGAGTAASIPDSDFSAAGATIAATAAEAYQADIVLAQGPYVIVIEYFDSALTARVTAGWERLGNAP